MNLSRKYQYASINNLSRVSTPNDSLLKVFSTHAMATFWCVFTDSSSSCLHRPGGSVVSVSDSRPGRCEFDPRLRRLFFPAYFRLTLLQKHVRKVVGGFGKKSCVSTSVRKPGNTYASPTAMI